MTRNDTPDKLEWSIRPRSGVDSAQCDWGISERSTRGNKTDNKLTQTSIVTLKSAENEAW